MKPALGIALLTAFTVAGQTGAFAADQGGAPPADNGTLGAAAVSTRGGMNSSHSHQRLQGALTNVSRAHTDIGKNQDWKAALKDLRAARNAIHDQMKGASRGLGAGLREADHLATLAERSIRKHSGTALKDLDRLSNRLNQVAVSQAPIQAGGGKRGTATGTNQSNQMRKNR